MRKTAMRAIYELAKSDRRVVFIGSDLGANALDEFKREFPDRFFMEGVSEAAIIGMAAGLAMDGYIPYVNTIATFLTRRCFEQIAIDLCLHRLPVRLIASGGGAVYAPLGPTHMALEDIAILRALPEMAIVAPADAPEMQRVMDASLAWDGPLYVRIAKGEETVISSGDHPFAIGRAITHRQPGEILIVSTGVMTSRALQVAQLLAAEGITAGVVHAHTLKPFDDEAVVGFLGSVSLVVTLEEHTRVGGLGSIVAEIMADRAVKAPLLRLAFPDRFVSLYGSQESLFESEHLQPPQVTRAILSRFRSLSSLTTLV